MQPIGAFAVANLSNVPEAKLIEEVVVTGIRPGPPLWKVKHEDHVLWVFGTVTPIPKRMEWDKCCRRVHHFASTELFGAAANLCLGD